MDIDHGLTYWSLKENEECGKRNYNVLYHGKAEKAHISSNYAGVHKMESIYTVDQTDMIFALVIKGM